MTPGVYADSIANNGTYPSLCQTAAENDEVFAHFKKHPHYQYVLEHVSHSQGQAYLNIIQAEYPDLLNHIEILRTNDLYGDPVTYNFAPYGYFSPTTLRYIKIAGDLRKEFGDLSKLHIVEIGAGYGGQCKVIHDLFGFASYTIIDLAKCNLLTIKYLDKHNVKNAVFIDSNNVGFGSKFDLVISNYAFSECDIAEQMKYIERVIENTPKGYMICNFISNYSIPFTNLVDILTDMKGNLRIEGENPLTAGSNKLFVWRN